jgi:hypothetical protein
VGKWGVPFSHIAEQRIREALARGEFDDLPNAGEPLDLETYFSAPPDLRMAYSILRNAKCAPAEVELLNEVARLKQAVEHASDPQAKQDLQRTLISRQTQLAIMLERRRPGEK